MTKLAFRGRVSTQDRQDPQASRAWRLHVLEIDPYAAEVVRRIFEEFLGGKGIFAIAEGLTADGILSPSAYDPARNRHRSGVGPRAPSA